VVDTLWWWYYSIRAGIHPVIVITSTGNGYIYNDFA
jgi:hypothetical protein